jgi:hypothetical protein
VPPTSSTLAVAFALDGRVRAAHAGKRTVAFSRGSRDLEAAPDRDRPAASGAQLRLTVGARSEVDLAAAQDQEPITGRFSRTLSQENTACR